ncbi:hypothetical protein BCR37DRAFT_395626 [Protomyces lactucae-debilis]|uniref:ER-bound oxygenase mpaB/mpaB'/Rubber oxygenase catalytic domain-containing protein n=1 Tax=Protomyces lactucae-debilis TaxID=2754530 RepID=A0A1Y2EU74_PROLT|nr:uncharacterized protein BCR37DRAFT_395626 [Protomyces lactucae-debilis]ORY75123.1 hypothetical protein BCR37DRAFT_395626 [Protomyces lactucae-debilis]
MATLSTFPHTATPSQTSSLWGIMGVMLPLLVLLACWIYLVRRQRRLRLAETQAQCKDFQTPSVAQKVLLHFQHYEEPFVYWKALEFSLFKTYAIPTISKLLSATTQLVDDAAKRAEDTSVLLTMASYFQLNSEEATLAIARINYIHGRYGSKISQDDLLYTLSLFVIEPMTWSKRFAVRSMLPEEQQASFVFWRTIGERMEIHYIPESLEALIGWSEAYEREKMKYADTNKQLAESTIKVFLAPVPRLLHPFARRIIYALLADRLRDAFGYPQQPYWVHLLISLVFGLRTLILANLIMPIRHVTAPIAKTPKGKFQQHNWRFSPHYVKQSLYNTLLAALWGWIHGAR